TIFVEHMVTLSFTIFSGQKNYNRAHMLFQVLCGFEPIFYTTHPNEESLNSMKSTKVGPAILTWQQQKLPLKICMSYTKMAY
ncbi:hypothetical protein, partial [Dysosmobacter welbionis]|uniref:hypothetical protein n=1 Tax=Dysosmobacter welbionis TaxID=2093857 RepID=UPI003A940A6B